MIILLLVLHILATADEESIKQNTADDLIDSIRRQLMENNYDYEPSEENFPGDRTPKRDDLKDASYQARDGTDDDRDKRDDQNDKQEMRSFDHRETEQHSDSQGGREQETERDSNNIQTNEKPTETQQRNTLKQSERESKEYQSDATKNDYQKYKEFLSHKKRTPERDNFYVRKRSKGSIQKMKANKSKEGNANLEVEEIIHSRFEIGIKEDKQDVTPQAYDVHSTIDKGLQSQEQDIMSASLENYLPKYEGNNFEMPEFRSNKRDKPKAKSRGAQLVVSKNDLLYYLDDDQLTRRRFNQRDNLNNSQMKALEQVAGGGNDTTTTKVKYKLLEIREQHPTRRKLQVRRFLEERNDEGVAVIKLDGGPFPQFKLPRSRRQYMADHDEVLSNVKDLPRDHGNQHEHAAADGNVAGNETSLVRAENTRVLVQESGIPEDVKTI